MRYVFIVTRYKSGTAELNRLLAYGKALGELGKDVHFYFLITNPNKEKVLEKYVGVTFHYVWEDFKYISNKILTIFYSVSRLKYILQSEDCVFTYHAENITLFELLRIRKKINIKIYNEETEFPHIYKKLPFYKRIFLFNKINLIKKLNGLFVITKKLQDYYIAQGVSNVYIINMIVDFNRFVGISKDYLEKSIVYCGAINKQKDGIDILIQAFGLFYKKHSDYKLYILGPIYNYTFFEELKQLINRYNITESVIFTGRVEVKLVPKLLKNASILTLARPNSLQAEGGFPTKLGEYLATSNPVVVTNVGEIGEFLKDGVNAYVAEPNSVEGFANKMISVADNYEKARVIGENGFQTALQNFSSIGEVKKILEIVK